MFITSVYFLDCKRARICAKVENDRAGQTKGREQEWKQRMRLRGETGKIRVHFARESHADASHLEKPILKKKKQQRQQLFCSLVYFESPNRNVGIFWKWVVERMVQPSASPCWAEDRDIDKWRRKYIIFLTQDVWPNKWFFLATMEPLFKGQSRHQGKCPLNRVVSWMELGLGFVNN